VKLIPKDASDQRSARLLQRVRLEGDLLLALTPSVMCSTMFDTLDSQLHTTPEICFSVLSLWFPLCLVICPVIYIYISGRSYHNCMPLLFVREAELLYRT